jgi:hypothetical protein
MKNKNARFVVKRNLAGAISRKRIKMVYFSLWPIASVKGKKRERL